MKKQDESFDLELSSRLRNYSEEPRSQLWQNIITTTEAQQRPQGMRKRSRLGWILLLGAISVGGLFYFGKENVNVTSALVQSEIGVTQIPGEEKTPDNHSATLKTQRINEASDDNSAMQYDDEEMEAIGRSSTSGENVGSVQKVEDNNSLALNKEMPDIGRGDDNYDLVEDSSIEMEATKIEEAAPGKEQANIVEATPEKEPTKSVKKTRDKDEVKTVIKEDKKDSKLGIYFTIMPTFGYQRIKSNSSDDILIESINKVSAFSTDRLGVRAELGVEDPLTKRIKVFGGLVYYQRKQTIGYIEEQIDSTKVTSGPNGEIEIKTFSNYVEKSFEYELKNLGVQIGVSYELSRKKLLQTIGTGFEFHVALNKLEESYQAEFTNNPSAYVFYNLYYRLQYPAEGKLKAVFQPTLNYSFYINQDLHAPFYVKPYGLGLNLGFTYNF